jgi:7,8-dihydro-6-hydroxymethylpterin-pyrophosphokinase
MTTHLRHYPNQCAGRLAEEWRSSDEACQCHAALDAGREWTRRPWLRWRWGTLAACVYAWCAARDFDLDLLLCRDRDAAARVRLTCMRGAGASVSVRSNLDDDVPACFGACFRGQCFFLLSACGKSCASWRHHVQYRSLVRVRSARRTNRHLCISILHQSRTSLFAWAKNKRLKVLLTDLCERKILLAGWKQAAESSSEQALSKPGFSYLMSQRSHVLIQIWPKLGSNS